MIEKTNLERRKKDHESEYDFLVDISDNSF